VAELRSPLVCGALGRHDRDRVGRIAAALGGDDVRFVHEDATSVLAMDREPLRWGRRRHHGLGWIEGLPWQAGAVDWRDAARRGACGLVLDGRHRRLHTSVNGLGSIYWTVDDGALYFSSRIDALVRSSPRRLTIDWDAWSSIIALRYPASDRTPFAEVRRLQPWSTLTWERGRAHREAPAWPWAEAERTLTGPEAGAALAQSLRDTVAAVGRPTLVPLSGGRDSRMLACAFAEAGLAARAVSVSDDEGGDFEEALARPVADALGLDLELLRAASGNYPRNWETRARLVEHQFVDHAWLVPLSRHLARQDLPVSDGFAMDVLLGRGNRFFTPETLDRSDPHRASLALFDSVRRFGQAHLALAEHLRAPLLDRARGLFLEVAAELEGAQQQAPLTFYRTRTVRGVACYPTGLLGRRAHIVAPAASHDFAMASFSATEAAARDDGLYAAAFEALAPEIGRMPSTTTSPRPPGGRVRLWLSEPAVAAHRERLAEGPLAGVLAPELRAWLDTADRSEPGPDLRLGLEGVSLLHSWWARYRDVLREVDVRDLTG
jgi:hypothetical protein